MISLREALMLPYTKESRKALADYVTKDKLRLQELVELFLAGPYRITQRAAGVLGIAGEWQPQWLLPYLPLLAEHLDEQSPDAVHRNILRLMQFVELPEELHGPVAEKAFRLFASPKQPVAVKVFAMQVLYNIACKVPELKNELKLLIEEQLPQGSAGFRSRGGKILKKLEKEG